jgi:hypothetical protein
MGISRVEGCNVIVPRRSNIAHHRRSWPAIISDKYLKLLVFLFRIGRCVKANAHSVLFTSSEKANEMPPLQHPFS